MTDLNYFSALSAVATFVAECFVSFNIFLDNRLAIAVQLISNVAVIFVITVLAAYHSPTTDPSVILDQINNHFPNPRQTCRYFTMPASPH